MKEFSFLLIAAALLSLTASAFGYAYWENVKNCPIGQYPECPSSSQLQMSTSTASIFSSTLAPTKCKLCPKGTSSSVGTTYNSYYLNNNIGCVPCWNGYANQTGSNFCSTCPEGSQCLDPAASPKLCPKGTALSAVWTDPDQYNNQRGCNPCPENYYANKEGSIQCSFCPPGFYCPDPRSDPIPCPKGTATEIYKPSYTNPNDGDLRCKPCPIGFFSNTTGSATCMMCPPGFYCPDPTRAIKCPVGTYRNNLPSLVIFPRQFFYMQSSASFCLRCPQGYYANVEGSTTCTKAPKGSYSSNPTVAPIVCPLGTYSSMENGQQQCYPCLDGSYTTVNGSKSCNACPNGYQCSDKKQAPKKCPLGTYSNSTMIKISCAQCPPGTFANTTGMTFCYNCPSTMCCDDPTTNPTPCLYPTTPMYTTVSSI